MKKIFLFLWDVIRRIDVLLFALCVSCSLFGIALITSATDSFGTKKLVIVQSAAMLMGLFAILVLLFLDTENLVRFPLIIYGLCIFALVLTLIIGKEVLGNKNWIIIGPISIQPSEFVKVGFIITFASHLKKVRNYINHPQAIIPLCIHFGIIFVLVLMEGDLGTALVFTFIFIMMLYAAGLHALYFIVSGVFVAAATPFAFSKLAHYQQMRILAVYDPSLDPLGFGYHTIQSKIALGSGGLTGSGLYNGIQTQYSVLPEKQTDFIFSVAGEELGFVGNIAIILLLVLLILRVFITAKKCRDFGDMLICVGVGAVLLFQAAENIGMCLGLLPVIGITLPFFSYGGSSMLASMCLMGLVMSAASHNRVGFFKK